MVAVERSLEYRELESEKQPKHPTPVATDWPSNGCIEFRNVFYRYFSDDEPVLCDLSFSIASMEKIGVVGRTVCRCTWLEGIVRAIFSDI